MNALDEFVRQHTIDGLPPVRHQKRSGGFYIGGPILVTSDGSTVAGYCMTAAPADPVASAHLRRRYWQILFERVRADLRQLGGAGGLQWPQGTDDWRFNHYNPDGKLPRDTQEAMARLEAIHAKAMAALDELDKQCALPAGAGMWSGSIPLDRPWGV
jgi:hypothetical protein